MRLSARCAINTRRFICDNVKCVIMYNINRQMNSDQKSPKPVKMAYRLYKDDDVRSDVPIMVMHGLYGSKMNWNSLAVSIQKRTNRPVYAVDARNHGDSPHADEHSYYHLAEDIKLFISDIKAKKAALIGHSMGGRAIMVYALHYPENVESLTVVDISPINADDPILGLAFAIDAMKAVKFKSGTTLANARKSAEEQLVASLRNKFLANFLSMNVTQDESGNFTWKLNLDTLYKSYTPHLIKFPIKVGEFKGPTLFVIGGESEFVSLKDVDEIKKMFPNSTFEIIEDTGHLVHVERPLVFSRLVSDFIKKHGDQK